MQGINSFALAASLKQSGLSKAEIDKGRVSGQNLDIIKQ